MTLAFVLVIVSAALVGGAAWGVFGRLSSKTEGFIIAVAGGALIVSVVQELIQPASQQVALVWLSASILAGAVVFTLADAWVDKRVGEDKGAGLLLAITLDGIPENLALGVALIGAGLPEVAALSASIVLSNLPEAAGAARDMRKDGQGAGQIIGIWSATAALLALAALIGYFALQSVPQQVLAVIRGFAAGAVVASLAVAVFPKAYREDSYQTGIAVAIGLVFAFALGQLAG